MRHLPPAGTPVTLKDLLFWVRGMMASGREEERLRREIGRLFAVEHVFLVSTGRAAMAVVLEALREGSGRRDQVILPSYTCFSVPSSVVKAGLQVRFADMDPATLDYDYEQLERLDVSKVLAIVSANLYGIPNDLERLESFAADRQIRLVDDAAQAMGATAGSRHCGTFGDVGIFSLDKGKVITSMNGGIIVTRDDALAGHLGSICGRLPRQPVTQCVTEVVKAFGYAWFIHPSRYWLPARLPFLRLGETRYTTDYRIQRYCQPMAGLALRTLAALSVYNKARIDNGVYYRQALAETPGLHHVTLSPRGGPIYLRFPLLVEPSSKRRELLAVLRERGLGASGSYPTSLCDIDELGKYLADTGKQWPGGAEIARRIVTLPTHPMVGAADRSTVVKTVREILQ